MNLKESQLDVKEIVFLVLKLIITIMSIFIPIMLFNGFKRVNYSDICLIDNCNLNNILEISFRIISILIFIDSIIFVILLVIYLYRKYFFKYVVSNLDEFKNSKLVANITSIIEILGLVAMPIIMIGIILIIIAGFTSKNANFMTSSTAIIAGFGLVIINFFTSFADFVFYEKKVDIILPIIGLILMIVGTFFL